MTNFQELYLPDSFEEAIRKLVPSTCSETINVLQKFQQALIEANKKVNLTRIESSMDFQMKHLIDSALLLYSLGEYSFSDDNCKSLLDFGTGGGIPGVPLAILKDFELLTLVDARRKKLDQIRWMLGQLNLKHLKVNYEHSSWKAKNAKQYVKLHNKVNLVTARAVGPVEDLLRTLSPVTGNCLLLPRGPSGLDEWSRASVLALKLGFKHSNLVDLRVHWCKQSMRRLIFQFFTS